MWNLLIGGMMVLGGMAGTHVLRATNSSAALVVLGAMLLLLGFGQLSRQG
jgi:hypothetical protein